MSRLQKISAFILFLATVLLLLPGGDVFSKEKKSMFSVPTSNSEQIIVKFNAPVKIIVPSFGKIMTSNPSLDSLNKEFGVIRYEKIYPISKNLPHLLKKIVDNIYLVVFKQPVDLDVVVRKFEKLKIVDVAEPDYYFFASFTFPEYADFSENFFSHPYEFVDGRRKTKISIIAARSNFQIKGKTSAQIKAESLFAAETIMAKILEMHFKQDNDTFSPIEIQTFPAGTIEKNNVAKYPLSEILRSLISSAINTSDVLLLPFWGYNNSKILTSTITIFDSLNCLLIAPSGEENSSAPLFPAAYENVLAISALNQEREKYPRANFGEYIDLSAPGVLPQEIILPDSMVQILSPTILSAYYVTATAAILKTEFPNLSPSELRRRLIFSCDNIYFRRNAMYEGLLGAGQLNPGRALEGKVFPNIIIKTLQQRAEEELLTDQKNKIAVYFSIENLSATAHDVRLQFLVSDALVRLSKENISLEKLEFGTRFSNASAPLEVELPQNISEDYQPLISLRVETKEGFFTQRSIKLKPPPAPPQNLKIESKTPISITWKDENRFVGYRVFRKDDGNEDFHLLTKQVIEDTIYVDLNAEIGVPYQYFIVGITPEGEFSLPSSIITARSIPAPTFEFNPNDSVLSVLDSVMLHVRLKQPDSLYALTFEWRLGDTLLSNDTSITISENMLETNENLLTLAVLDSAGKIIDEKKWLLAKIHPVFSTFPQIVEKNPVGDTLIAVEDTIIYFVKLNQVNFDSVRYQWFLNDSADTTQLDSFFVFIPDPAMTPPETLRVECEVADTTLSAQWVINWEMPVVSRIEPVFIPLHDTLAYEGDTLVFRIIFPDSVDSSSFRCFWEINGKIDSTNVSRFQYIARKTGKDSIFCHWYSADSLRNHIWIVNILSHNSPPEVIPNVLPGDTTIFLGDTLELFIDASDADGDSLYFSWLVNSAPDSSFSGREFIFYKQIADSAEADTISLTVSDADTSVNFHWIIHFAERKNVAPVIEKSLPDSQVVILESDSCHFQVWCKDADGDSLSFQWLINDSVSIAATDSIFLFNAEDSPDSLILIKVIVSDGMDSTELEWQITRKIEKPSFPALTFFPAQDTIEIAPFDSVIFSVSNVDTGFSIRWFRGSLLDSVISTSDTLTFSLHALPILPEIVTVKCEKGDSLIEHNWLVLLAPDDFQRDSLLVNFYPQQDTIFGIPEDSVKFEVSLFPPHSNASFVWELSPNLVLNNSDSAIFLRIDHQFQEAETLRVKVELPDTILTHQWEILVKMNLLPEPVIIFPTQAEELSEFDGLIWQPDTNLANSHRSSDLKYVVQLSEDSTFSKVFSSDTIQANQMILSQCSHFEKFQPQKTFFWRVQLLEANGDFSLFAKSPYPFIFKPEFSTISDFKAELHQDGIMLSWRLVTPGKSFGFNVYRQSGENSGFVKVNEQPIRGEIEFQFFDKIKLKSAFCEYKLEEISLANRKKEHQIISIEKTLPSEYSLSQNSPNPFNSSTSFQFEIPEATHVIIEVYNILGKKVKTLVNERREAGFYTVHWDGIDDKGEQVGSGIYFYYMTADQFHATHKMIVVR